MTEPVPSTGGIGSVRAVSRTTVYLRDHTWALSVWSAVAVWTAALFVVVRDAFLSFRFARFDLGNMVQAVWSTAEGRPLEMTHPTTAEQVVRLGFHVDPILALLAPLWMIAPSPLTLAFVQVVAVSLGALPVFWLARRHSGSERTGAMLALAYLLYPWVAWGALDAFHPVSLAIPLFLFCIWFLDTDRRFAFVVCAVLVVLTGELMGILVAGLGVWYAFTRGQRRVGAVIAATGAAWTIVALYLVVPAFSGGASLYYGAFSEVGGSPLGILETAATDPVALLSASTRSDDLVYLFVVATPLAGAFLLAPGLASIALIPLTVNLLAGIAGTTDPHEHYVSGVLPFLFAAIAVGIGRLSPLRAGRVAGLVLVLCAAASIAVGPWPGISMLQASSWDPLPTSAARLRALDRAVARVPEGAPVSATNRLGSHLSARRYFYSAPVVGRAEWIVIESADTWLPRRAGGFDDPERLRTFRERIERSPAWQKVSEEEGVLVFRMRTT
jgi:uncharacterized membrane protein